MQKTLLIMIVALMAFNACIKEPLLFIPLPETDSQTPASYVNVFYPGDTTEGVSYALKNNTKWSASATCNRFKKGDLYYWTVAFFTYDDDLTSNREILGVATIPDDCLGKTFIPKWPEMSQNKASGIYIRAYSDGDVFKEKYKIDTTATDNFIRIDRLDRIRKRMEGVYSLTFKMVEPRLDPFNPLRVKFSSGRFAVKLPD